MPTYPEPARARTAQRPPGLLLRSLLPIAATLLVLSTIWIGPWGFLVACIAWWQILRRIR
jgi:hypothetical protein